MSKHSPISADALQSVSPRQSGGAAASRASTFTFRTTLCEACDDGYMLDDAGLTAGRCDECEGAVKVDASCVGCSNVLPLNSDGECRRCFDAGELPVAEFDLKYATGWLAAERSHFGMGVRS